MSWEHIELSIDDAIATVTLNRPEALNALSGSMRVDLVSAIETAAGQARALVIAGAGKAFCSGGDVKVMSGLRKSGDVEALAPLIEQGKNVVRTLRALEIPTMACVGGAAAGAGLSLALACDLRIASADAVFSASFSRIGLHPDWGGTYFLTRLAGAAVARDLIFSGRRIDAREACELGLVNWVVDRDELSTRTREKALELAGAAPLSIRYARATIDAALDRSLEEVFELEEKAQLACFRSDDALEGIRAFEERRPPQFKGK